jgi:fumarate reductase subunit C
LNLAYYLHDGYKDSDKDNPANIKSETIRKLYWTLLQYRLNQYQKPISSRWLYQLKTGEQYLERKEIHFKFASWFVPQLENSKNVPQNYIKKWKTFLDRLQDPLLNIQIKCMVKFGRRFYAEVFSFLTGYDATPRVLRDGILARLPPGNRAHELPDQVLLWLGELQEAIELPEYYFADELEEASSKLPEDKFQNLRLKLKLGIKKASESFSKWMECWIHLPLSICRLGGDRGPEFARAIVSVIMNRSLELNQVGARSPISNF